MALALSSLLNSSKEESSEKFLHAQSAPGPASLASNVLDYVYTHSAGQQGARASPASSQYGMVAWGVSE